MRLQHGALADRDVFTDQTIRPDVDTARNIGTQMHDRARMNHACKTGASRLKLRGSVAIENISSAEQTNCPSTFASQCTQPMLRLCRSSVTSIIRRSPGT